jgi:hypothetical protein
MAAPKIVYPTGGANTLSFGQYPRLVPAYYQVAARTDSISTAGVKQSILQRIHNFLDFTMEYVALGTDVTNWAGFFATALAGTAFDYYPDSSLASFTTYTLEDVEWKAAWKSLGRYTFKMKMRQVVT